MSDLIAAYDRLARGWTHEELAGRYRDAKRRGERLPECDQDHLIRRPIAMLASAVPACASLSVAIHVIHVLPTTGALALRDQLLRNAENNSAIALHRCHQALELDGQAHDYSADEWLPAVYDIAAPLLEAARLNREPPTLVEQAQEAVRWLSHAIVDLDHDAPDAAAAIVDGLGRILALHVFADVAAHANGRTQRVASSVQSWRISVPAVDRTRSYFLGRSDTPLTTSVRPWAGAMSTAPCRLRDGGPRVVVGELDRPQRR